MNEIKGVICIHCKKWFTVISNLSESVIIRYCPFCGHLYTEEDWEEMISDIEIEEDDPDYDEEDEEDEFEEDDSEEIDERGYEEVDDDSEDEDSVDMELD